MMVDANILLYAVDEDSPFHERAVTWLTEQLNGNARVALPWSSLGAFLRIVTHPRALANPLATGTAWEIVREWLDVDVCWTPVPTEHHAGILGDLIGRYQLRGNLIADAQLAALAIEHGLDLYSNDTDFARFQELTWVNPLDQ